MYGIIRLAYSILYGFRVLRFRVSGRVAGTARANKFGREARIAAKKTGTKKLQVIFPFPLAAPR